MQRAGCAVNCLEWNKVERIIEEVCAQSNLTITVCDQIKREQPQKQDEAPVLSALGKAQSQHEALSKLSQWIEQGKAQTTRIARTS